MSRLATGLTVFALLAGPAVAQGTAYFPSNDPSTGSTNTFPMGNAFGPEWRYQGQLSAANLPAGKIKITDVSLAPSSGMGFAATQFQVRMTNSTAAALTTVFATNIGPCPTVLYDGPLSMPGVTLGAWNSLGMQTSFGYDGDLVPQPNIVYEIRYQGRSTLAALNGFRSYANGIASMPRLWANSTTTPTTPTPYTAVAGRLSTSGGVRVCLTYSRTCICDVAPTAQVGTSVPVDLIQMPVGASFQIAASLGQGPAIALPGCNIGLAVDGVFFYSITSGAPVFNGYNGVIPASGSAQGKFAIPAIPALAGLCVYHAALGIDRQNQICCTNTEGTMLTP